LLYFGTNRENEIHVYTCPNSGGGVGGMVVRSESERERERERER